ncbi:MAG TPA: tetratricopeptide repeat protein, partial [bacterium]
IQKGVDHTFSCQFDSALLTFQNLIDAYPESPLGYFYRALALRAMMIDMESNRWEKEFEDLIDRSIDLSQKQIEHQIENTWDYFYLGSSYFLKGFSQAKSGKIIGGVINARKGLGHLNEALKSDSTLYDVYLILGNYDYLTGRYYKYIDWLPGISDNRQRGIERLKIVMEHGSLSRWAGIMSLGWIEYDRKNYNRALDLFQTGNRHYPDSRFFLWALADTYLKLEQYDDAVAIYQQLLITIQKQTVNNLYNELVLHYQMASAYTAQQKYENALEHCEMILEKKISGKIEEQFGSRFDKTKKMHQNCLKKLASQSYSE